MLRDLLQTAFRMVPWPTEPGLREIGRPGRSSPVLLTCNYDLTVRRLERALEGVDAWLLVAPTKGINVWCAAAGGHMTTHQVITALKTSGIAEAVDHRELILPQLAATGIEGLDVHRRSHWRVRFGPARAEDIPSYLAAGGEKSDAMRRVSFPLRDRLEMATAWAAPAGIVLGAGALLLRPAWALPLVALCAGLSLAVFTLLDRMGPWGRRWLAAGAVLASTACVLAASGSGAALAAAVVFPLALTGLLTFDYAGSTPVEGSGLFDGRAFHIRLDSDRCAGIHRCWEVCPEACFEKDEGAGKVLLAHDERCIRCGACIVQCPLDALDFVDDEGGRIGPETVRRFKLNLMGRRSVPVAGSERERVGGAPEEDDGGPAGAERRADTSMEESHAGK